MGIYDNYPPGVTGNEYEIAGPDKEWEEQFVCKSCGFDDVVIKQFYKYKTFWECPGCDEYYEEFDDDY